jgi:hypothetical protein
MGRRGRIVDWNGNDLPSGLQDLPAGRYRVEAIDDAVLSRTRRASSARWSSTAEARRSRQARDLRFTGEAVKVGRGRNASSSWATASRMGSVPRP